MIQEEVCNDLKQCIDTVDADLAVVHVLAVASLIQKVQELGPLVFGDVNASNGGYNAGNRVTNKSTFKRNVSTIWSFPCSYLYILTVPRPKLLATTVHELQSG